MCRIPRSPREIPGDSDLIPALKGLQDGKGSVTDAVGHRAVVQRVWGAPGGRCDVLSCGITEGFTEEVT